MEIEFGIDARGVGSGVRRVLSLLLTLPPKTAFIFQEGNTDVSNEHGAREGPGEPKTRAQPGVQE